MIASIDSQPATSYDEAMMRARTMMALDDDTVAPAARTMLRTEGTKRPLSVVLFHGLTNHPGQYAEFIPLLVERGVNVFVPRLPHHGYRDRMTRALASLTAEEVLATANRAIDIGCGLGERVAVLGISLGGLLAAYFGQFRSDVDTAVPVSPSFALLQLTHGTTRTVAKIARALPNVFLWWDPRLRAAQRPLSAYPRFPTHALGETLRIGDAVIEAARTHAPKARRIVTIVNRADPAVNNAVTEALVTDWRGLRRDGIGYIDLRSLPENHDIIDPDNPRARTESVYPKLLEALGAF